jgi:hypothetical protein
VLAILALRQARQEVKRQLKARGERVALMSSREITLRAEQYLAEHRQALMEQARDWIMSSPELRAMYERDLAKRASQISKHMNKTRATEMPALSQCKTYVRNGEQKC